MRRKSWVVHFGRGLAFGSRLAAAAARELVKLPLQLAEAAKGTLTIGGEHDALAPDDRHTGQHVDRSLGERHQEIALGLVAGWPESARSLPVTSRRRISGGLPKAYSGQQEEPRTRP